MFATFSKEKLFRIGLAVALVLGFVFVSLVLNNKFKITDNYDLYTRKTSSQISYVWSHKILRALKNPGNLFSGLAGAGYWQNGNPSLENEEEARSIPVLVYHGLPNEGLGQILDDAFVEQMRTLKNDGWQTITLEDFKDFMKGEIKLRKKSFLLTFDDGRKDTFYPADPVLRDLGFHAIMFAISKQSLSDENSTYYISDYELVDMEKSGRWEIESHGRDSHDWYNLDAEGTIGHFFSNRLWLPDQDRIETEEEFRDRIIYDLSNSKKDLDEVLDKNITAFAFPFSDFGQDSVNYPESLDIIAKEVPKIYDLAFYQAWSGMEETFNYPNPDFMIKRMEPRSEWSGQFLVDSMNAGLSKDLPYTPHSYGLEWVENWGEVEKSDSSITLKAEDTSSGASTSLNGSRWWENYLFTTIVEWEGGSNIVLLGRKSSEENYYGCNFGKNKISIKRSSSGSSYNILTENYDLPSSTQLSLGMKVEDSNISCLVDGEVVLTGNFVNSRIPNGGIGLEVWDESLGAASAVFKNISVTPI